jgi:hypothetical protein
MDLQTILITILCFIGGFAIVNRAWAALDHKKSGNVRDQRASGDDVETYYRRVLGVGAITDSETLTAAYLGRMEKYEPGKFREFGSEFEELAVERTKDIAAAYEYLIRRLR